jgi:hypothetical protein
MASIRTENFGGMTPAINSRSLPPNAAVDVVNARVHEGKITPLQQLTEQFQFPNGSGFSSAVRIPDPLNNTGYTWLGGTSQTFSFSRPAINDDEYERYTYCNGSYKNPVLPRYNTLANIRNGVADYQLGVVQPTFIPVVSVSGGAVPSASSATVYATGLLAGSGYAVGDTITLAGGVHTEAMVLSVDEVDTTAHGAVVSVTIVTGGNYTTTPSSPVLQGSTSGKGSGAGFTITFGGQGANAAAVADAGTNYAVGDTITVAGGTFTEQCVVEVGTLANAANLDANGNAPSTGPIATAFISVPGIYTTIPTSPTAQSSTSGEGTGAEFYLTFTGQQGLTATVYSTGPVGGTGYQVNDTITLAGGTLTSAATPTVLTVASVGLSGTVTGVYVSTPGAYTTLPTNPVGQASTSGQGTGAEFVVVWEIEGAAQAIPTNAGSGYEVGDVLTVVGGISTEPAKLTVATLTGTAIATVTITSPGEYTVYPTSPASVTGGAGTGATFNISWAGANPTETRAYVCTYVDVYGQESAPSDGGTGTGESDGTWLISGFGAPPSNPGAPLAAINIYRTITESSTTAAYYFVAAVPFAGAQSGTVVTAGSGYQVGDTITVAGGVYTTPAVLLVTAVSETGGLVSFEVTVTGYYQAFPSSVSVGASTSGNGSGAEFSLVFLDGETSYLDTSTDEDISLEAVQLQTQGWLPPIAMEGFISVANGFLCGWAGNQIYFSQPSAPWAWPVEYQTSVDSQIVGMGYLDGSIVVLTTSSPYQLTGTSPAAITNVKVSTISPCTSRGSIAQAIDGIDYAAPNGIMNASPYGFVSVSDKVISEEVWRDTYFSNVIAGVRYEDTYMGLLAPGEGYILALQGYEGGYFMNPQNVRIALSRFLLEQNVTNMFQDPFSNKIFMMAQDTVYLWDDPSAGTMVCRWKSKEFASAEPVNFAAFIVAADDVTYGPQNSDDLSAYSPNQVVFNTATNAFFPETDPSGSNSANETITGGSSSTVTGASSVDYPDFNGFIGMLSETAIVGFDLVGAFTLGSCVGAGTTAPDANGDPNAMQFPYWPGLLFSTGPAVTTGAGPGGSADPDWGAMPALVPGTDLYVEVYANRFTVFSGPVNNNIQTRLPSGFKANLWQYSITSNLPVWSMTMATSAKELRNAK